MKTSKGFLIAALLTGLSAAAWGVVAGAYGDSGDGDYSIHSLAILCPGHPDCPVPTPWEIHHFDPADARPGGSVAQSYQYDGIPLLSYDVDGDKAIHMHPKLAAEIRRLCKDELSLIRGEIGLLKIKVGTLEGLLAIEKDRKTWWHFNGQPVRLE